MVYIYPSSTHHDAHYDTQYHDKPSRSASTDTERVEAAMKVEVDGPSTVAEKSFTSMQPPSHYPQPSLHLSSDSINKQNTKRRQSRFDPMGGQESEDEEGYGDLGHRHPLRKLNEEDHKSSGSFTLPGIKSLLNPSSDRESSTSSTPYGQSPSLPSLVSNSPSGSPSTLRTSRYSSLASGSSISADSHGWWAPDFERTPSHSSVTRSRQMPAALYVDDHDGKRRRSDQPQSGHDTDEQARLRWMAQSRNASFPMSTTMELGGSSHSSPIMRSMQPPIHPSAHMSRQSRSHQDHIDIERRPSAVPRSLSLVSGPLSNSFADLSANERDRERERQGSMSHSHDMPPPFPSPLGLDRDRRFSTAQTLSSGDQHNTNTNINTSTSSSSSFSDIQHLRANTSTPPERYRAYSHPSESDTSRPLPLGSASTQQRTARSSLSEMIMAQSGDDRNLATGRFTDHAHIAKTHSASPSPYAGWQPTRRSSGSSTQSASTPGMTVTLNSDDGHTPLQRHRRDLGDDHHIHHQQHNQHPQPHPNDRSNPMGGMDVLAESARRVSEEEETRRSSGALMMDDRDREDSPKGGNGGPGGPKYQCAYCSKTFSRPSSLRIHTYSHTGERPFICQEPSCGRRFSVQSNLKRHAKVHQLGQAGGASLHQLHHNTSAVPHRGPGPGPGLGQSPGLGGHGYYSGHSQHSQHPSQGYGRENGFSPHPYSQPQPLPLHGHGHAHAHSHVLGHAHGQRGQGGMPRYHGAGGVGGGWNDVEEDELDDEDEDME